MFKLFRFLKTYRYYLVFIFILTFFQSLADLNLPTLMADIVNNGIVNQNRDYILKTGGYMLLVAAGGTICSVLATLLSARTAMGFGKILRGKVFSHVESFSLHEFDKIDTPSLITRNTNDITQIQMVTFIMLRMMISAPMMCIGGIIMAVSKDPTLSWIFVVIIPFLATVILILAGKMLPLSKTMQIKIDKINLVLREGLTGIRVIRAFNRIDHEQKRFHDANLDLTSISIKFFKLMALMMPIMIIVMNFSMIAILWFGGIRIDQGLTNIGNLMAFLQYAMQIMMSVMMASMMFIMVPRAQASAMRVNEVLAIDPEIKDPEQVKSVGNKRGYIEFKNVTFSYHGAEEPALKNISFAASPGEVTAIIGSTGSGKSTLVNLIPRFYDADSGCVLIDGVDVRDLSQETLRAKIGFVPQKAVLFSGTIAENIRYGKEEATDDEVRRAAEIAQAAEFITGMKDGYDSVIAQGGANISGGQKQRLAIARALIRRPEIYIFDDSFSALDFKTDARLRAALKKETADATVIIVGQRVATIMDADRIIVLDDGQIAGIGTHKVLLKTCEVYREIVYSQLSEEELA